VLDFLLAHHRPEEYDRCYAIGSQRFCARCAGLYAGGLLGLLAAGLPGVRCRPTLATLVSASAPTVLDFVAVLIGLPSLPNWPRFIIAVAPGAILGLLLADAVADVVAHIGHASETKARDPVQ